MKIEEISNFAVLKTLVQKNRDEAQQLLQEENSVALANLLQSFDDFLWICQNWPLCHNFLVNTAQTAAHCAGLIKTSAQLGFYLQNLNDDGVKWNLIYQCPKPIVQIFCAGNISNFIEFWEGYPPENANRIYNNYGLELAPLIKTQTDIDTLFTVNQTVAQKLQEFLINKNQAQQQQFQTPNPKPPLLARFKPRLSPKLLCTENPSLVVKTIGALAMVAGGILIVAGLLLAQYYMVVFGLSLGVVGLGFFSCGDNAADYNGDSRPPHDLYNYI